MSCSLKSLFVALSSTSVAFAALVQSYLLRGILLEEPWTSQHYQKDRRHSLTSFIAVTQSDSTRLPEPSQRASATSETKPSGLSSCPSSSKGTSLKSSKASARGLTGTSSKDAPARSAASSRTDRCNRSGSGLRHLDSLGLEAEAAEGQCRRRSPGRCTLCRPWIRRHRSGPRH